MTLPSTLSHLECARCAERVDADRLHTVCACGGMLLARYDLARARESLARVPPRDRPPGLWRWADLLPVRDPARQRGLGEGGTPLRRAERLGASLGLPHLYLKDEGRNPGGSFKARGMAVAVARAVELGARRFALPSAGNAGGAAAAYAAYWGCEVNVALPRATPESFRREVAAHGGRWHDVDGDIADAGEWLRARPESAAWFFLSTLREPYRVEGKKTMGYELVEAWGGAWPDVVIYPTGGGTGIMGMAKAAEEMAALGLSRGPGPRWVVVQMEGCAPLVRAFESGSPRAARWEEPETEAYGLRVPATLGDEFILRALRESGGTAVAVREDALAGARRDLGAQEGIYAAPEAAATVLAARRLRETGWLAPSASVVLFVTGNGFKYAEAP